MYMYVQILLPYFKEFISIHIYKLSFYAYWCMLCLFLSNSKMGQNYRRNWMWVDLGKGEVGKAERRWGRETVFMICCMGEESILNSNLRMKK